MAEFTEYTKQLCDKIIEHGKKGKSVVSFRGEYLITQRQFDNWITEHEEFEDAVDIAEACFVNFWENQHVETFNAEPAGFGDEKGLLSAKDRNLMSYNILKNFDAQHTKSSGKSPFVQTSKEDSIDPTAFGSSNVNECMREFD